MSNTGWKGPEMQEHGQKQDIGSKLEAVLGTHLSGGSLLQMLNLKQGERIEEATKLRNGNISVLIVRENSLGKRYRSTILNPLDLLNAERI